MHIQVQVRGTLNYVHARRRTEILPTFSLFPFFAPNLTVAIYPANR
jgi:hypothetical protein